MRINDRVLNNTVIRVVEDKKVVTPGGIRRIFVYEASVKNGTETVTKQSESLSELQRWVCGFRK